MPNDSPDWAALTDVAPIKVGDLTVDVTGVLADNFFTLPITATGLMVLLDSSGGTATVNVFGSNTTAKYASVFYPSLNQPLPTYAPMQSGGDNNAEVRVNFSVVQGGAGTKVGAVYALGASGYQVVTAPPLQPLVVTQVPGVGVVAPAAFDADALVAANGATVGVIAAVAGQTITVFGWDVSVYSVTAAHTARGFFGGTSSGRKVLRVGSETITAAGVVGAPHCLWLPTAIVLNFSEGLQFTADAGLSNDCIIDGVIFATQH